MNSLKGSPLALALGAISSKPGMGKKNDKKQSPLDLLKEAIDLLQDAEEEIPQLKDVVQDCQNILAIAEQGDSEGDSENEESDEE